MLENRLVIAALIVASMITAVLLLGCDDVPEPTDLDHDRIIAVRTEPPGAPADGSIAIDALITDTSTDVRVVAPTWWWWKFPRALRVRSARSPMS